MFLKGFDVSHWQGKTAIADAMNKIPNAKFVIIKATEGVSYVDPNVEINYKEAVKEKLMTGFYHYARPEKGNTPEDEAMNFISTIKQHIGTSVLCLDYEGDAHKYGYEWALRWLRTVYRKTGVKPLIYLSGSHVKAYAEIAKEDFGLWIASWTTQEKMQKYMQGWKIWALWQYSNSGGTLDLNNFNGTEGQFLLYAATEKDIPGYCGCCGCCCE